MMKSKKGLLLLFIVQLILVLSLGVSAAEAAPASDINFTVEAPSAVKEGQTFKVTVSISENKGFALAIPKLTYDADLLTFDSFVIGNAFGNVTVSDSVKLVPNEQAPGGVLEVPDPGRISMSIGDLSKLSAIKAGLEQPITATGLVAELTFTAKASAEDYVLDFALETANNVIKPDGTINGDVASVPYTVNVVGKNHKHTEAIDAAVAPTCTEAGLTEGKHCSFCGEVLLAQKDVAALGHNYNTFTSNGDGTHTKVCANDATHTELENCAGGQASCKEKALCEICKGAYGDFAAHVPGAEATCTEPQKCSVCGEEVAPAKGHTAVAIPDVEATKETEGSKGGTKCSVCGTGLTQPEVVPLVESTLWIWIIVIIAVVVVGGAVAAVIVIKKKKSN